MSLYTKIYELFFILIMTENVAKKLNTKRCNFKYSPLEEHK